MKKLVLSIIFLLGFVTTSYAQVSVGVTLSLADVESAVSDDIDSDGTTDTTKDISNEIAFGSIFIERAVNENMSIGLDFIPFEAEFESRSTTQVSLKDSSTTTSGTNKGTADVRHLTFYLQPQKEIRDLKFWNIRTCKSGCRVINHSSTDKTVEQDLDGIKLGLGLKKKQVWFFET